MYVPGTPWMSTTLDFAAVTFGPALREVRLDQDSSPAIRRLCDDLPLSLDIGCGWGDGSRSRNYRCGNRPAAATCNEKRCCDEEEPKGEFGVNPQDSAIEVHGAS